MTGNRRHRRIAYRVTLGRIFDHNADSDLVTGEYRDTEGEFLGRAILEQRRHEAPAACLVIPEEDIPLVHVEASLEADSRFSAYEQVFALLFRADEAVAKGVSDMGERWDDGEVVAYAFESDEEALEAQG